MATARTLIETIVAAHFVANGAQVEQLAHNVVEGMNADGTYLRVVLAHMQAKLGRPRRGKQPPQEPVLESVHESLYPHVLRGVGPDDLDQRERFRRATFARSAASTIRYFVQNGGDVRGLDIATVTKGGLRNAVKPETPALEGETRAQRAFRRASETVLRTAQRMARGDPAEARRRVETLMDELEGWLNELDQRVAPSAAEQPDVGGATTTIVAGRGAGRGAPAGTMLHRPA